MRAEALDVVLDALKWEFAGPRWEAIEPVVAAMEDALAIGDLESVAAATEQLELAGPLRIKRIGSSPLIPPPPPVRDRLNRLVHALGSTTARDDEHPPQADDDDDASHR